MKQKHRLLEVIDIVNFLYKYELFNEEIDIKDAFENYEFPAKDLKIIEKIAKNYSKLVLLINKFNKTLWKWERINPYERALLIYGSFELGFVDREKVINGLVILAKEFSPGQGYKIINAILDKIGIYYETKKDHPN